MKKIYFLLIIVSVSCGRRTKEVVDYRWRDSLQSVNRDLQIKCDSLESVFRHESFSGIILDCNKGLKFGDTAKFNFLVVFIRPKLTSVFHYTVRQEHYFDSVDWLNSLDYSDSILVNQTSPTNNFGTLNYKKGINYLIGYYSLINDTTRFRRYTLIEFNVK